MLQAELRVISGKQSGSGISLPMGKFLVGREEDCHLRPNSDLVSRHHCVFTLDEYGLRLRDLGSTNGCFVNGEKIRGAVVLNAGDAVSIGKLDFKVLLGDPITEETITNLQGDLPTEILPISPGTEDPKESPPVEFVPAEDDTIPAEASSSETLMDIPLLPQENFQPAPAAEGQGQPQLENPQLQYPPTGDTQYFPPQGIPQMPVGYPPQMGYPQGMVPPYGYPGYPQQGYPGYPQQGYPPGMYPPQQMPPAEEQVEQPPADQHEVRLPDPSETGLKAPEPAPPVAEDSGEKKDERTADQKSKEEAPSAAADAIQQYLQRRPKGGK